MLNKICAALLIVFIVVSISFAGSEPNLQEGNWEITTKVDMPGIQMPPVKHTQCLTKKDLVPQSSQPGQECEITQSKVVGNTVSWTMRCSSEGNIMEGTGKITYSENSFEGTIRMLMPQANMEMINHISGQRIGDCQ